MEWSSDVFLHHGLKQQACVKGRKHAAVNFSSSLPFSLVLYQNGGWMTFQLFYLSRSLSRSLSLSLSLLWLRTGDCPLAMEWWEMGGDALAGLEEEVVEEELLVERSKPPPPPPVPVPLLLCLMPLSSMPWPPPPVTSFHNCWSSAGLRPAREIKRKGGETKAERRVRERNAKVDCGGRRWGQKEKEEETIKLIQYIVSILLINQMQTLESSGRQKLKLKL